MQILYRRCAALDIHKKTVCACIRRASGKSEVEVEQETFGTFTGDLEQLGLWLKQHKVKRVAMESTGVYWIPVWNVLEQKRFGLELLLVNPALVKALPGQKTDPKDAARIVELHQYGLLRGSFIPPPEIRRLRDLVRQRVHSQQEKNRIVNRIGRLLETANVKLGSVASNIVGMSGRRMLYALSEGESDAVRLAGFALGTLQKKQGDLVRALQGRFTAHFRERLTELLGDLEYVEKRVDRLESKIRGSLMVHTAVVQRLRTIPGVDEVTAWTIISEIGLDMTVFASANHLASWAGLCPGNDESAGKRRSGTTRKGNRYLRRCLVQNGWAIGHTKDCFLTSLFMRIARRRGMKKACVAVAHRILVIAYYIIRDGVEYRELGGDHHDRLHPLRTTRRLVDRLSNLGFEVELRPKEAVSEAETLQPSSAPGKRGRPKGSKNRRLYTRHYPVESRTCSNCTERGIPCIHGGRPLKKPSDLPLPCRQCAGWGLAQCIHAKNSLNMSKNPPAPEDSSP